MSPVLYNVLSYTEVFENVGDIDFEMKQKFKWSAI